MIKSMTGYGRAEFGNDRISFMVEIKSVNHKFLDMSVRLPRRVAMFENRIRAVLKEYISRGKVDVFVSYDEPEGAGTSITYHKDLAGVYLEYIREIAQDYSLDDSISALALSRFPDVFTIEEITDDEEALWSVLLQTVQQAGEAFVNARETEGTALKADLDSKLEILTRNVAEIELRAPEILKEYRSRLENKLSEVLADTQIDENRLATELVLFSDKMCTDEETVRLAGHIQHMREVLADGDQIGRKLDFLAQEMNREANTILSKANDLTTSNLGIELKTDIEKIREQVQNIE